MKYKSELIKDIGDTRGHKKSSLHYESECIETWIEEAKGGYPKLCDYQSEWLSYINKFEGGETEQPNPEPPIGEFPYVVLSDVTDATIDNVVPYAYKSAILKGSTKYRDVDTGEVLDAFEDGRNLELVSVKMPVLKTTGKNLFDKNKATKDAFIAANGQSLSLGGAAYTDYIRVENGKTYINTIGSSIAQYDINKTFISRTTATKKFVATYDGYIRWNLGSFDTMDTIQIEESSISTSYEPYKSNILTVNEDVTLRSNGSVCDELDLLTGKLTQRIDEDGEILTQEVVKTVDLSVTDQDGNTLSRIKPIEGTMHISTEGTPIKPAVSMEIPVEAITQNLASFIKEE